LQKILIYSQPNFPWLSKIALFQATTAIQRNCAILSSARLPKQIL
jgi:hypothetical protein